jgi:hypothetical protein
MCHNVFITTNAKEATMTETLATRMAQAIDHQTLVEMAVARVAAMFPYGASSDGMDYAYASTQCLAELMSIVKDNAWDDATEDIAEWLSTPVTEWYACDGDIRFDIDNLVEDRTLATEWIQMVEAAWE